MASNQFYFIIFLKGEPLNNVEKKSFFCYPIYRLHAYTEDFPELFAEN